jgi:cytochrome c-type biogenesis protein CcmE
MAALGVAAALVLSAFEENLVFFYSPSDLKERDIEPGRVFRLGGLVEEGSVRRDGARVNFRVTDLVETVPVTYAGILPDLFREGQGVVTEGELRPDGSFHATNVLAKHDETYMPKEVADALKESGVWRDGATEAPQ